jgi:large subunit ribosomal protein L20
VPAGRSRAYGAVGLSRLRRKTLRRITPETNPFGEAPFSASAASGLVSEKICSSGLRGLRILPRDSGNPHLDGPRSSSKKEKKPMPRVKRGTKRRARRKKYLKRTKGFFLTKSKLYQSAQEAANRAERYAKRDRRVKKREYRRLWIQRVGAAARLNGITYGQLIHGLKAAGIAIDRKVLADMAVRDAAGFAQLVERAKAFAPRPAKKP